MNVKAHLLALALLLCGGPVLAQGFAGLGSDAEGFALPERRALTFPADHGAHPAFRIEWWYLTANLTGADGRDYGVQWTLFRSALAPERRPGWTSPQLWLGHAAVSTPDAHYPMERFARDGTGQADVRAAPFAAHIDDWQMVALPGGTGLDALRLTANGPSAGYDLALTAQGPLVAHGQQGYSVKSAGGQASHYYSQPFYAVTGTLNLPEGAVRVTGNAWLDREWSSQPLEGDQTGWDWISLHLDSGDKLMAARVRDATGAYLFGTWITPQGAPEALGGDDVRMTPLGTHDVADRTLPVRWRVEVPARGVDVDIEAVNPDAWMALSVPYWEGPMRISGSHAGRGYLEMTGY